jgi:hypothetical protein
VNTIQLTNPTNELAIMNLAHSLTALCAETQSALKRPVTDGTTRVLFEPNDFIARLAALVQRPHAHLIGYRYHGLFAPNARHRHLIVSNKTCEAGDERSDNDPELARPTPNIDAGTDDLDCTAQAGV